MFLNGKYILSEQAEKNILNATDKSTVRVLTIGESTTSDLYATTPYGSWPRQLEKMLKAEGIKVNVINTAVPATNTNLILLRLKKELELYRPHIVIAMMGINDSDVLLEKSDDSSFYNFRIIKLVNRWYKKIKDEETRISLLPELTESKNVKLLIDEMNRSHQLDQALVNSIIMKMNKKLRASFYVYLSERTKDESLIVQLLELSLLEDIWIEGVAGTLSYIYSNQGNVEKCYSLAKAFADKHRMLDDFLFMNFSKCSENDDTFSRWQSILEKYGEDIVTKRDRKSTYKNYQKLVKMLKKKGIKLIVMQYPTLPVDVLKKALGDKEVKFVSNEENFKEAMRTHRYEEIFTDNFGGTFGHTTDLGHELIAKAALKVTKEAIADLNIETKEPTNTSETVPQSPQSEL